jgi:hypothetical protein
MNGEILNANNILVLTEEVNWGIDRIKLDIKDEGLLL